MTPSASRKASERARRKERGEVALSGWLSASDHAALTQMARDSGMTQAQVVSRLIGMVGALKPFAEVAEWRDRNHHNREDVDYLVRTRDGIAGHLGVTNDDFDQARDAFRHSDLTAAVGLVK